jgi:hypothetical protein
LEGGHIGCKHRAVSPDLDVTLISVPEKTAHAKRSAHSAGAKAHFRSSQFQKARAVPFSHFARKLLEGSNLRRKR